MICKCGESMFLLVKDDFLNLWQCRCGLYCIENKEVVSERIFLKQVYGG